VDSIKCQVQAQVLVDPTGIISNSNHSTGPLLSLSATGAGGDHKMVPAAIGSERKRHMPPSTSMASSVAHIGPNDWSSISKRKINNV
jgi:hypothetical protein